MQGLLRKDLYVITKQLKIFLIAIPVMAIIGGGSMYTFAILLGSVIPMTAIAYDERSRWSEFAVMMPYTKKDLVLNKYLLGYVCMLVAAGVVIIAQLATEFLSNKDFGDSLNTLLFAIIGGLMFVAINTPVLFKFGSEKGRFVFIIAAVLIGASGPILSSIDSEVLVNLSNISPLFFLGVALALNYISILISISIKSKLD